MVFRNNIFFGGLVCVGLSLLLLSVVPKGLFGPFNFYDDVLIAQDIIIWEYKDAVVGHFSPLKMLLFPAFKGIGEYFNLLFFLYNLNLFLTCFLIVFCAFYFSLKLGLFLILWPPIFYSIYQGFHFDIIGVLLFIFGIAFAQSGKKYSCFVVVFLGMLVKENFFAVGPVLLVLMFWDKLSNRKLILTILMIIGFIFVALYIGLFKPLIGGHASEALLFDVNFFSFEKIKRAIIFIMIGVAIFFLISKNSLPWLIGALFAISFNILSPSFQHTDFASHYLLILTPFIVGAHQFGAGFRANYSLIIGLVAMSFYFNGGFLGRFGYSDKVNRFTVDTVVNRLSGSCPINQELELFAPNNLVYPDLGFVNVKAVNLQSFNAGICRSCYVAVPTSGDMYIGYESCGFHYGECSDKSHVEFWKNIESDLTANGARKVCSLPNLEIFYVR